MGGRPKPSIQGQSWVSAAKRGITAIACNTLYRAKHWWSYKHADRRTWQDGAEKDKCMVLDIAPLNGAQLHFTTLEVAADWHWL